MTRACLCVLGVLATGTFADDIKAWRLSDGRSITGRQVEATSRVIVVEDLKGRRHVVQHPDASGTHGSGAAVRLGNLNPQAAPLVSGFRTRLDRLSELHRAGRLSDDAHQRERVALEKALMARLGAMHPELTVKQIRKRAGLAASAAK